MSEAAEVIQMQVAEEESMRTVCGTRSPKIGNLVKALAAAQKEYKPLKKTSINPFYSTDRKLAKYAELGDVIEATQVALASHGLTVIQLPGEDLEKKTASIETILAHESEEWISCVLTLPAVGKTKDGQIKFDAQTIGAAQTYARRYTYGPIVGIAAEPDDDANSLSEEHGSKEAAQAVGKKKVAELSTKLQESVDSLFYIWYDESQTAEIKGAPALLERHASLLKPFVTVVNGKRTIVVNAEQFENLKYEFEKSGTPFHSLKANTRA